MDTLVGFFESFDRCVSSISSYANRCAFWIFSWKTMRWLCNRIYYMLFDLIWISTPHCERREVYRLLFKCREEWKSESKSAFTMRKKRRGKNTVHVNLHTSNYALLDASKIAILHIDVEFCSGPHKRPSCFQLKFPKPTIDGWSRVHKELFNLNYAIHSCALQLGNFAKMNLVIRWDGEKWDAFSRLLF